MTPNFVLRMITDASGVDIRRMQSARSSLINYMTAALWAHDREALRDVLNRMLNAVQSQAIQDLIAWGQDRWMHHPWRDDIMVVRPIPDFAPLRAPMDEIVEVDENAPPMHRWA